MAMSQLGLLRPALCRTLIPEVRLRLGANTRISPVLQHARLQPSTLPALSARPYATKKSKVKAKGQSAKLNINSSLVEDILNLEEVKSDMAAILAELKDDFSRNLNIRTSPGALDHIVVSTSDGKVPLNQLGQISMKSPQLIVVNMAGSPEAVAAATRALRESSMRLNPEEEGTVIKVPIPMVTREHRENLVKLAKTFSNKAKEALRRVRSSAVTQAKKAKDTASEDTIRLVEKQVQQMTDNFSADIDKHLATKSKELLG